MEIIDNLAQINLRNKQVVTIGVFDGFHSGHREVADITLNTAKRLGLESTAVTFEPFGAELEFLTTIDEKLELFRMAGFSRAVVLRKADKWKEWTPEEFIKRFLIERLNSLYVVVGKDFRFGKDRLGDINTLKNYNDSDINIISVNLKRDRNKKISSTYIKKLLREGNLEYAEKLLGRKYFFIGNIVSGEGVGKKIGFPTVNFNVSRKKILPWGVFLAETIYINMQEKDNSFGACYIGKVKIGKSDTKIFKIEFYFINYADGVKKNLSGIRLLKKIREPKKFESLEELRNQITHDIKKITQIIQKNDVNVNLTREKFFTH